MADQVDIFVAQPNCCKIVAARALIGADELKESYATVTVVES